MRVNVRYTRKMVNNWNWPEVWVEVAKADKKSANPNAWILELLGRTGRAADAPAKQDAFWPEVWVEVERYTRTQILPIRNSNRSVS
jgi:hypothetical protein